MSMVALWFGDPISGKKGKQLAVLASPITHISADDPPLLAYQGTGDALVKVPQATNFHEAYKKAGLESTVEILEGVQHNMGQVLTEKNKAQIEAFFDKHIRGKS
jgi:acetyl esterase/lipase